ncbi:hypothetical protein NDU88_005364 [Pleurodeles waltl]|uniref:Uncharacterized protein n=1 Tax=Pleurodeles waltl TaxID=8319 RepID=A0AAV7LPC3_PLEWA|nr:hypothetical protein NDU88_005364 [Pleurodeles waltl]
MAIEGLLGGEGVAVRLFYRTCGASKPGLLELTSADRALLTALADNFREPPWNRGRVEVSASCRRKEGLGSEGSSLNHTCFTAVWARSYSECAQMIRKKADYRPALSRAE